MKKYFVSTMLCLLAVYGAVSYASAEVPAGKLSEITFKDFDWDPVYLITREKQPIYLKQLDFQLPPFPANDSAETRAELDTLLDMQKNQRTPETVAQIKKENKGAPVYAFAQAGLLDLETHPKTVALLSAIDRDIIFYLMREKTKYRRARPTMLEPALIPVVPVPGHPAYPSAHSAETYAAAYALAAFDPAREKEYVKLAGEIAVRREIGGLHYPSDTTSGADLAQAFYKEFIKVPEAQKLLTEAQQEYKH